MNSGVIIYWLGLGIATGIVLWFALRHSGEDW